MIKIIEFKDLTPLEEELLNKAPTGEDIGQMLLPDEGDASKRVRASLLRALLLGDLDGVSLHPKGASMRGAWIDGDLDFEGCELSHPVKLVLCRFSGEVIFLDAHVPALYLPGSHVGHLNLHRLRSDGVVHLRKGFRASAGVNLGGAQISGQLDCNRGHFENANGIALKCTVMTVGEDVLFCDGFKAVGEVSLLRAQISGQLACDDGHFENANGIALDCEAMSVGADVLLRDGFKVQGKLDLVRARTTGNLRIEKSEINGEVDLESARVDEGFFWKDISGAVTTLDLTDMSVGVLRDEKASWECVQQKHFKGFRYDRMDTSIRVSERLKMLAPNTAEISKFNPQPHTQFAKVLTDAGYRNGAARVRFEREEHLRRAIFTRGYRDAGFDRWTWMRKDRADLAFFFSGLFGLFFGHGHKPARAFIVVGGLWLFATMLYSAVFWSGQMAPNSDVVLTSQGWLDAVAAGCAPVKWSQEMWNAFRPVIQDGCDQPLHIWSTTAETALDYETFNARLYALDLFVPLDALGQENAWAPSKDRGWWGWFGYAMRMPIQMAGWVITAMGAAVVTGLIGRKE